MHFRRFRINHVHQCKLNKIIAKCCNSCTLYLYMFGGIGMYESRWRFESQKMSMMPHEVFSGLFIGCPLDSFVLKSNWLDIFDLTNKYKA